MSYFIYDDTYILIFLALKVQNEMHKNVNILYIYSS